MRGWVMASRRARALGSANTMSPRRLPVDGAIGGDHVRPGSGDVRVGGLPGAPPPRAPAHPRPAPGPRASANICATVDLPEPMPPVRPNSLRPASRSRMVPYAVVSRENTHPRRCGRRLHRRGARPRGSCPRRGRPRSPSPGARTWASRRCSTGWPRARPWPAPRRRRAAPAAGDLLRAALGGWARRSNGPARSSICPATATRRSPTSERESWQPLIEGYARTRRHAGAVPGPHRRPPGHRGRGAAAATSGSGTENVPAPDRLHQDRQAVGQRARPLKTSCAPDLFGGGRGRGPAGLGRDGRGRRPLLGAPSRGTAPSRTARAGGIFGGALVAPMASTKPRRRT